LVAWNVCGGPVDQAVPIGHGVHGADRRQPDFAVLLGSWRLTDWRQRNRSVLYD